MRLLAAIPLAAALLAAAPATLAAPASLAPRAALAPPAPPAPAAPADEATLRRELLHLIAVDRAAAGLPPLQPSAALDRAAQEHSDELAARGSLQEPGRPQAAMERRMAAAGYDPRQWVESLLTSTLPADADSLMAAWRNGGGNFRYLDDPEYADVGVGFAHSGRRSELFVSILFAESQGEFFARQTAPLRDLPAVRADLVARINQIRRGAGAPRLAENHSLELAAQRHAEDMLARSFFAHRSPSATTVRERSQAAGYDWRAIAENLAEGQPSAEEAVDAWMHSAGHRENILDHQFVDTGIGLALGRDPHTGEYRILWVQTFGHPR